MNETVAQEKGFDMKPMIGGMMGIMLLLIAVQLVGAAPPETANLDGHVRDSEGNPIDGALVSLDGNLYTTGTDGYYSFTGLTFGAYNLEVTNASALGYQVKPAMTVTLNIAADYVQDIVLTLPTTPEKANLSGVVRNYATGALLDGVTVSLDGDVVTTNIYGIYSFSNKELGGYTLSASKDGFTTKTKSITLVAGDNSEDIYLPPAGVPTPEFEASDLTITPATVNVGEPVEIGAMINNIGDAAGTCTVGDEPGSDILLTISPSTYTPAAFIPTVMPYSDVINFAVIMMFMGMMVQMTKGATK